MAVPLLDILVAVHYDNLPMDHFVRGEVEARMEAYFRVRRPIYNLSTLPVPSACEGMIAIPRLGKPGESYGLARQLDELKRLQAPADAEIIGVAWWICVEFTKERLKEAGFGAVVNLDATDHVADYVALSDVQVYINHRPIPLPSEDVLERYLARKREEAVERTKA